VFTLALAPISELRRASVRTGRLSRSQLTRAKLVYFAVAESLGSSLEDSVAAFSRDVYPGDEIQRWEEIAGAYLQFTSSHALDASGRKEVLRALLEFSIGIMSASSAGHYKHLTAKDLADLGAMLSDVPPEPAPESE